MMRWPSFLTDGYLLLLGGLSLYALHVTLLLVLYFRHRHDPPPPLPLLRDGDAPVVTVQLPLRNEGTMTLRLLEAVAAFDWPREALQIQVLDDSDDGTTALLAEAVRRLQREGVEVELLHRERPCGFKAGAMAAAMPRVRGDFIALFDADFLPPGDFLRRTVPYFLTDSRLGMVQTRWKHRNAERNLITRVQAMLLDAHFAIEQVARNRSGLLINFNGTAGVWRKAAILDAGGWQDDTLTEDLDLSYRAQLRGWRALYLEGVTASAELPPLLSAFQQQQYRWAKGSAQVLRKLALPILRSPRLTPFQKGMALFHLSGYFTQVLFLGLMLLLLPMLLWSPRLPSLATLFGMLLSVPPLLYLVAQVALYRDWPRRLLVYPLTMLIGTGLAWGNSLAWFDGLLHRGGEFVRTPKGVHRQGLRAHGRLFLAGEALLTGYALLAAWMAWQRGAAGWLSLALFDALAMGTMALITGVEQGGAPSSRRERRRPPP